MKKKSNDRQRLELIYSNLHHPHLDYLLLENTDNFDWDVFMKEYYMFCNAYGSPMICESAELLKSDSKGDQYLIIVSNKSKFLLNLNIIPKEDFSSVIFNTLCANISDQAIIRDIQNTSRLTVKPIIQIVFEDEDHMKTLTGTKGIFTWQVMSGIMTAFSSHCYDRQYFPDILYFQTLDEHDKRNQTYVNFFKRDSKKFLENYYADKRGMIPTHYHWKTLPAV